MKKGRIDKFISFTFSLLAVFAVWMLNPPLIFHSFALMIGAQKDSILYVIIVNGFVPLALALAAWFSVEFYQRIIWPLLPNSEHKGGWWIYSLIAETESGRLPVVGYFKIIHKPEIIKIDEGRSFYFDNQSLVHRGDWHAETAWQDDDKLRFVFTMHAINNPKEPLPSNYDGFIDARKTSDDPKSGVSVWCGYFHDLADRREVAGPICAEYLGNNQEHSAGQLRSLLERVGKDLIDRVETRLCD